MKKISFLVLAVLLLAPMFVSATEGAATEVTEETLPQDVTGPWTSIKQGLTNTQVYALAIDRANPSTLYAGTNGGVFKSADWGENWSAANSGLTNTRVWALAIDPSNTSVVYAGTEGGVFKSNDGGSHWSASSVTSGVPSLAIDPSNSQVLYAGTMEGVYKSVDGGRSWNLSGLPLTVNGLAIDPSNTDVIYAITENAGIYRSPDGGRNWFPAANGLTCFLGYALAIDPANPSTLYAGGLCAVFKSTNGGETWAPILITPYGLAVAVDPENPGTVYAGTWGTGVYKGTDGGAPWSAINDGLTNRFVTSLAIDPSNTGIMYAGTWGGVFKASPAGTVSLYVSKSGTGGGTVTSAPSGIDCGSTCTASYDVGSSVTLTAAASAGSIFASWSGACTGTGDCVLTMDGNKQVTATFNVPGQPGVEISIAPESLSFGTVQLGKSSRQTMTITNPSGSTAALTGSVGTLPAPFFIVGGGGAFSLAPGQSMPVLVEFLPTTAGAASASLSVTHNAANRPNPSLVPLTGAGIGTLPAVSVTPKAADYGSVKVSKSKTLSFKVTNTGKGDLIILYSKITGRDGSMFSITSGRGSKTLGSGKSMTIKVAFKPASAGPKGAALEITSNDRVAPTVGVPLTGTGQEPSLD